MYYTRPRNGNNHSGALFEFSNTLPTFCKYAVIFSF